VTANDEYSVEVASTFQLLYREGHREMKIAMDFRDPGPILYGSAIRQWNFPHEGDVVSPQDQERIIRNASNYLSDVRRFSFDVDPDR
jgi:hypothetical protein